MTYMTRRVEGVGHKLFMDNNFSFPDLFDDLAQKKKITVVGLHRNGTRKGPKKTLDTETETG
jgi:hypothetical protein